MSIHAALHHRTTYTYDRSVTLGPQTIRLRPAPHCRTKILSYSLKVEPSKHFINWQQDSHANYLARLVFPEKTQCLDVTVDLVAEMSVYNPFDFFLEEYAEESPFVYEAWLKKDIAPYLEMAEVGPLVEAMVVEWKAKPKMRTIDYLVGLNSEMQHRVSYLIRMEPGVQSPEETLKLASGSCRDSGWLLVNVLRGLGFAARFVSGYLIQLKADVKSLDGPSGTEVDFTDLHAWCEVYLPGAGWIGLDPTSGLFAGEGHIPVACTPEPMSAAPVSGAIEKCESVMHHEMTVTRIHESPRVTMPYSEAEWQKIVELGRAVDKRLKYGDVRLTMGGEPTFISIDDMDGAEWNFTAVGPKKRALAGELLKRMRARYAPSKGLLHYGQGKWYPGEVLPRWSLGCWWRKDGQPIWKDESLVADETKDYGHGVREARVFADRLMDVLGVKGSFLTPAYEDIYYYLWREGKLPANVEVTDARLKDKQERERLRRLFSKGLGNVVGYVLPLKCQAEGEEIEWVSGPWKVRDKDLFLIPGDSPMGYRLPMDALPWVKPEEAEIAYEKDPLEKPLPLGELRPHPSSVNQGAVKGTGKDKAASALKPLLERQLHVAVEGSAEAREVAAKLAKVAKLAPLERDHGRDPALNESASWVVRTALCVEPREGRLHIFMPPVEEVEGYLELVAAIEETAKQLSLPVIIEGSTPPFDMRLEVLKVTPDPGVIEVNLHPSSTWDELVEKTETLYDEARLTRLGTEKFMLDGRHTGTGGGNHIIIGAATPTDSPVLRRPDLLKSLLCYWQNHPSLSYLFTGLFIGPTSQAPRVDEARNDSLYELELAFNQVPDPGGAYLPPWTVDRLFRNLLVDATGNTHRAEFCIDKMFSPDSSTGRLGLLELRSYEMPPHARMSVSQQLLLRALVAHFWEKPYRGSPVRWGTEIHDRWMLPHFLWDDFSDVMSDLQGSGFHMKKEWFEPHFEFRFPFIGEFVQRGVQVELRSALEPWHVLGEDSSAGSVVRYVDSSVERLQVKVSGMIGDRFAMMVNGKRVPLHPTGINGEGVCGVRYRAWQPPNCLHPLIGVDAPLTFDLVDTWNQRSMGGCRYHVAHPGGRSYETLPVNAYEAESRRLARFESIGHTGGPLEVPAAVKSGEFPFTLDLRE
ncbi:transglutaminase family protein [Phragmitibacter flavus]|uniref:Transglutaminase family protein n=1 Tax=Phragmitibacter flavus TaxID=2576071 RepID=A0A5R8KB03_9BACT|nr:transglutaminase family protein [Phragmitibacter flavus]TLD69498.1 transglutaminase family protein [Phragmitibacter flavus]